MGETGCFFLGAEALAPPLPPSGRLGGRVPALALAALVVGRRRRPRRLFGGWSALRRAVAGESSGLLFLAFGAFGACLALGDCLALGAFGCLGGLGALGGAAVREGPDAFGAAAVALLGAFDLAVWVGSVTLPLGVVALGAVVLGLAPLGVVALGVVGSAALGLLGRLGLAAALGRAAMVRCSLAGRNGFGVSAAAGADRAPLECA
jgi:hypothetical protein